MKKIFCYIGIGIGILCILFSFIAFDASEAKFVSHQAYGGDAYTGIQNAAADTANNVNDLYDLVSLIGGYVLLISGALISLKYSKELYEIVSEESEESYIPTTQSIKFCEACHHSIPEGSNFCANCGNKVYSAPVEKTPNDNEWKCSKCGLVNPNYTGTCACGNSKYEN